jgi:hypothetical protein
MCARHADVEEPQGEDTTRCLQPIHLAGVLDSGHLTKCIGIGDGLKLCWRKVRLGHGHSDFSDLPSSRVRDH